MRSQFNAEPPRPCTSTIGVLVAITLVSTAAAFVVLGPGAPAAGSPKSR
jgi:hypothetical protein